MLTDPFFGSSKEAENPDLDGVAQEAISSLLRVGCLFAKFSKDSIPAAEVEELRQKAESYRFATLEAYGERDKLLTQVEAKVITLNNLVIEMCGREDDLSASEGRVEELEDEVDDMQKELDARAQAIVVNKEACIAKDKELASLRDELASSSEALDTVRAQLEVKDRAIAEAKARASSDVKALRTILEIEAVAEAVEERDRGFFLAKAQVQHLYKGLDLSGMGAFKRVTPEGLVGPNEPQTSTRSTFWLLKMQEKKKTLIQPDYLYLFPLTFFVIIIAQ
ncbi:uncharacterized protein LOC130728181 [Lotus japonicus]|uniref:uncharacterized protein LOC130728181 n=1 Tax=Lotus japonicus TaxID=34305 RepID=UPI00258437CA|nr:uncharacterized protein LOC130728181 [Lotus japonicus]